MRETIAFRALNGRADIGVELMVDTEIDVFEISVAGEVIMSGLWSSNLRKVFQRALEIWKAKEKK